MAKPATEARLAAAARGFTQVIGRGNAHIITKNPTTGKCAYDGQVGGGWHYNEGQETDTAWVAGVAPWNYQMVKAGYNLFALSNLSNGQVLKWLDPSSGQYVTFQPMALQWTNSLNQIQQISMPQSVAAQVSDDILYWQAGYGTGRHFKYIASPSRLNKLLIIDSAASLPSTSYDTLELNFIMGMSAGVTPYIDSGSGLAAWGKKTTKDTAKAIEFRLSGGAVVWSFAIPRAWDSAGNETTGSMRLKKSGSDLYVSVRFPKAWIDTVPQNNYPITFDPTLDYQVGAGADDGHWDTSVLLTNSDNIRFGRAGFGSVNSFMRFTVTIPNGATIDSAYMSFYYYGYYETPPACALKFEDAANPAAISSISDGNSRTLTTNSINVTGPTSGTWWNTASIASIIAELVASYNYESGSVMQCIVKDTSASGINYSAQRTYDYSGNVSGPKLHIEYTEASTDLEPALIGGKLIFGGLTLNGLVGR